MFQVDTRAADTRHKLYKPPQGGPARGWANHGGRYLCVELQIRQVQCSCPAANRRTG